GRPMEVPPAVRDVLNGIHLSRIRASNAKLRLNSYEFSYRRTRLTATHRTACKSAEGRLGQAVRRGARIETRAPLRTPTKERPGMAYVRRGTGTSFLTRLFSSATSGSRSNGPQKTGGRWAISGISLFFSFFPLKSNSCLIR